MEAAAEASVVVVLSRVTVCVTAADSLAVKLLSPL